MRTRLHLISAPWAEADRPSIQIGALRAHVEKEFHGEIDSFGYSAYLEIPYRCFGPACFKFTNSYRTFGEEIYRLIYHICFRSGEAPKSRNTLVRHLHDIHYNNRFAKQLTQKERQKIVPLKFANLEKLIRETRAYVAESIMPNLIDDGVNVIGFTMNFNQVYPSLVLLQMIREQSPNKKFLFVFGGFSTSMPEFLSLLKKLKIDGLSVIGEGEQKLEAILRDLLNQSSFIGSLTKPIPGVYNTVDDQGFVHNSELLKNSQLQTLDGMPGPILDDYFDTVNRISESDTSFRYFLGSRTSIIEGSRGCFSRCDFCNFNQGWTGFRHMQSEAILQKLDVMYERYQVHHISFIDNVCDTFAEKLAKLMIASNKPRSFFMNMRAHHPESFWATLSAAGMGACLIGIEALSGPLLKQMTKGTHVVQNLRVMKFFSEFGIKLSASVITHHPRSTSQDALETLRILDHLGHLQALKIAPFSLYAGSPLFNELSPETRKNLKPLHFVDSPRGLSTIGVIHQYEMPPEYRLSASDQRLWQRVERHPSVRHLKLRKKFAIFEVVESSDTNIIIIDSRFSQRKKKIHLKGIEAKLFDLCHAGMKIETIEEKLSIPRSVFENQLSSLVTKKLVLLVDEYYITLALRTEAQVRQAFYSAIGPEDGAKLVESALVRARSMRSRDLSEVEKTSALVGFFLNV